MALRFLTAGESHGPELVAILEGLPAGLQVDAPQIDAVLERRQRGYGSGGRMDIEHDRVRITAGVMAGRTTGAPVAMRIANVDHANWSARAIPPMTVPRPGHADLSAAVKYGYRDLRLGLERASARETAARVAVGALCTRLLAEFGVRIAAYVTEIGPVVAQLPSVADDAWLEAVEASDVRCPDKETAQLMRLEIDAAAAAGDSLGGVFEVLAMGVPAGLGSHVHWDRRLSSRLFGAMGSIPAVRGVELGQGFSNSRHRGTEVNAGLALVDGAIRRLGGSGDGIEAGVTTGELIVVRAAMKPLATTLTPRPSVDLLTGSPTHTRHERSDVCAVPRAAVVGEAMVAYVLADALLEKIGGDSVAEMRPRFASLRRGRPEDLPMDGRPWRLGYEPPADERPSAT